MFALTQEVRRALHRLFGNTNLQCAVTEIGTLLQPLNNVCTLSGRAQYGIVTGGDVFQYQMGCSFTGQANLDTLNGHPRRTNVNDKYGLLSFSVFSRYKNKIRHRTIGYYRFFAVEYPALGTLRG